MCLCINCSLTLKNVLKINVTIINIHIPLRSQKLIYLVCDTECLITRSVRYGIIILSSLPYSNISISATSQDVPIVENAETTVMIYLENHTSYSRRVMLLYLCPLVLPLIQHEDCVILQPLVVLYCNVQNIQIMKVPSGYRNKAV